MGERRGRGGEREGGGGGGQRTDGRGQGREKAMVAFRAASPHEQDPAHAFRCWSSGPPQALTWLVAKSSAPMPACTRPIMAPAMEGTGPASKVKSVYCASRHPLLCHASCLSLGPSPAAPVSALVMVSGGMLQRHGVALLFHVKLLRLTGTAVTCMTVYEESTFVSTV